MLMTDKVNKLPQVGPYYAKKLEKLAIYTVNDLLLHLPSRYLDFRKKMPVKNVRVGETVVIQGKLLFLKNQYTKSGKKIQFGKIADDTGELPVVWFNQPYLTRTIFPEDILQLAGEIGWFGQDKALISPEMEKIEPGKTAVNTQGLVAVYPETAGISSKWLRKRIKNTLEILNGYIPDHLPTDLLTREGFPNLAQAITDVHFPPNPQAADTGRRRLAFDELLFLQLKSLYRKQIWQKNRLRQKLAVDRQKIAEFIGSLPFKLTPSQVRSIAEISQDLQKTIPMNRLLEGDVGSGKTVVAAVAAFINYLNNGQTIIMAPTQILAAQHFKTFQTLFNHYAVKLDLITAGEKLINKDSDIIIGTHALLNQSQLFRRVDLVIIDEQHVFGVRQRSLLINLSAGSSAPHVLTMTATPIPRTVALTFYGDLDLSTLDELPAGRIPTTTWIVPPQKRDGAYAWIKEKIIQAKVQVFIVCPLIEESTAETFKDVKAAKVEYEKIKKIFSEFTVDLLHGRQKAAEKNGILKKFRQGQTQILVATPVVEVGIDIPNANIMIIEGSERFGLAALHQLRGRIGRGGQKSYCLLMTDNSSTQVLNRLTALQKEKSGFKLAEIDLNLRGPGEIFGLRQHGFPEIKIANWNDTLLMKKAKSAAVDILKHPQKYPGVKKMLADIPTASN